jgi:PLP dependent protein
MNLLQNYSQVKDKIPESVQLVAVSKFNSVSTIRTLYEQTGHLAYGESRVQELLQKQPLLPEDILWHFIGHLQTNKVKYIAPFIHFIESVDSYRLLKEINKEALNNGRIINVLLQFHIASEESKFGLSWNEAVEILEDTGFQSLKNINVAGVMGMASFTDNHRLIRKEFTLLRKYFEDIKKLYFQKNQFFREISMGMSGDYQIAIEEGSTMVRIGSLIFGER